MMLNSRKYVLFIIIPILLGFSFSSVEEDYLPFQKLRGDEPVKADIGPCYLGGRQSPGDQIGQTAYDLQADYSYGQRLMVDGNDQAHIDWMWQDYPGQTTRYCAWNARYADGSYAGETQASNSWSGYVQLDITRETDPDSQRTVITYHYDAGAGYYGWIDIDQGNLWGSWPNNPTTPGVADHIWPTICVANNNNILMATGDYNANQHHVYLTTDEGENWIYVLTFDSCGSLSRHLRSSGNAGSNKVVFVNTQFKEDSTAASAQLDCDVFYTLSTDGGLTWGSHINITDYNDSVRAYCEVNAVFDVDDNLHIVWSGRKVDSLGYYEASKIFHWDEVNDTITVVSSPSIYYNEPGGWWIDGSLGDPGAWRMPADMTQLVADKTDGYLYCLWHGNDDTTDVSADGWFNGEIYGAYSTNGGVSWSDYVNLTNTRSAGANPGACYDEDYLTANPYVVNDSIWTTYVEDKDAGAYPQSEGALTENPVRCWVFPTTMITGMEEHHTAHPGNVGLECSPTVFRTNTLIKPQIPNPKLQSSLNIYDASGRLVKFFPRLTPYALRTTLTWRGEDQSGQAVPAGIYFITLTSNNQRTTKKVIKIQ